MPFQPILRDAFASPRVAFDARIVVAINYCGHNRSDVTEVTTSIKAGHSILCKRPPSPPRLALCRARARKSSTGRVGCQAIRLRRARISRHQRVVGIQAGDNAPSGSLEIIKLSTRAENSPSSFDASETGFRAPRHAEATEATERVSLSVKLIKRSDIDRNPARTVESFYEESHRHSWIGRKISSPLSAERLRTIARFNNGHRQTDGWISADGSSSERLRIIRRDERSYCLANSIRLRIRSCPRVADLRRFRKRNPRVYSPRTDLPSRFVRQVLP